MLSIFLEHDLPSLGVDFQLPIGTLSAIVGPSGSGKTSVLRAVAGLLTTEHSLVSFDKDIWANTGARYFRPAYQRPLGFVSQTFGLFPHLTAAENVGAALTHLRRRERSREAQNCLDIVGIGGLADRRPNELSGGQSQRVAMARALARKPKLLLLDEPFSALDHSTRKRLRVELKRLQDALAMTVLFVTHDLDEAAELSETLVLLRRGKVIQQGPTRELLRRPSTVEAARLMNFANLAKAEWAGSDASGITLRWGDVLLTAAEGPKSQPYDTIHWTIRTSDVFLVKDNHPNESSLGTILPAEVVEVIEMGSSALVSVIVNNSGGEVLRLQLRPGALHRHNLSKGLPVRIALHAQAIVLLN